MKGRPKKYKTEKERKEARRLAVFKYNHSQKRIETMLKFYQKKFSTVSE